MNGWLVNAWMPIVFPKAVGRISYLVRWLLLVAIFWLVLLTVARSPLPESVRVVAVGVCFLVWLLYGIFFVTVPRLRDFGLSPWALLLVFVPFLNAVLGLCLVFCPENTWPYILQKMRGSSATPPGEQSGPPPSN